MHRAIEEYVRRLGLDAYLVGGAVRDELLGRESTDADFLVPGVDHEDLRRALSPHGRTEPLVVADQLVGVRLHPRERELRRLAPAGIEFAPPRDERSTGPGRHDFVIVADPSLSVEDDMRRRDFTINAVARRLETGELVDPLGGERDLRAGVLRTVSPRSFQEDPLRLVRGLRFVSQLDLDPDEETLRQMHEDAARVRIVSGERIGGGLAADGLGELSKLLLGTHPLKALRLARETGVLVALLPEFEPAVGFDQENGVTIDEHTFATVQAAADAGLPLAVRLAALFHDLGKSQAAWRDESGRLRYDAGPGSPGHEEAGAELARKALRRLRYPSALQARVRRIVRWHMLDLGAGDAACARRLLARHGDELALDLVDHRIVDTRARGGADAEPPEAEVEELEAFRRVVAQERASPHRIGDLAIDGNDLIALGFRPGPKLGATLQKLLEEVVEDPSLNRREELLARARKLSG